MANPFQVASGTVTGTGTSRSVTVANATSVGDTLLVVVDVNNTTCTVSACTDSKGNVYTLDKSFTSATPMLYAFRSPGATGGPSGVPTRALTGSDTVTVTTVAISGNVGIDVLDAPGVGAVDQIATITSGTSTTPSVSATPAGDGETVVSYFATANGGGAPTVNNSYTSLGTVQTGSNPYGLAAYKVLTGGSGVSQTSTLTIVSAAWRAGMWTFSRVLGVPYTVVAGNSASGATTLQVTVSSNAATGDTLVIGAGTDSAAQTVTGVTDSQGNTYTPAVNDYNQSTGIAAFTCRVATPLVSGTDWIKATYSGSAGSKTLQGRGCAGVAASAAVDVAIFNDNAASTAMSTGASGTLAAANEWAVAFSIGGNSGGTPTSWSGGFTVADTQAATGNQFQAVADQVVSSTGSLTAGATITSTHWAMLLVTLRAANTPAAWKVNASQSVAAASSANVIRGGSAAWTLAVAQTITQNRTAAGRLAARLAVSQSIAESSGPDITKTSPPSGLGTPYTFVSGSGGVGLSATLQVTVEATTATGDCLVVGAGSDASGNTVSGVTDSQGNTYVLADSNYNQSDKLAVFYALNTTQLVNGVDWVKATYANTGGIKYLNGRGCSGVKKTAALDKAVTSDNAASTAISSGTSGVLGQGSEWAVAFTISGNGGGAPTSWTGGFTPQDTEHVANHAYQVVADQVTTATTALNAGATILSTKWAAILVTFKAGSGTNYLADVAETVTVNETATLKYAAKPVVAETVTASTVAGTKLAARAVVSETLTVATHPDIVKRSGSQKIIDLAQVVTVTPSVQVRKLFKLQVSQSLVLPVNTGSTGAKLADVSQHLAAATTAKIIRNTRLDVGQLTVATTSTNVAPGAPHVVNMWTDSAATDYGLRIIAVDNNQGNCLVAYIGWSADTFDTNPVAYVADDAHNNWTQLWTSPASGLSRGSIWICTNAQIGNPQTGVTTVSVSTSLPTAGIAITIGEISNLPAFVQLSGLENGDRINNGTSISTSGTATGPAWGFALCVSDRAPKTLPAGPWAPLATSGPPNQGGGGPIAVTELVTVGVTAGVVKGNSNVHQIDVSQTVTGRNTSAVAVGSPPPPPGSGPVLYVGANTGPQGAPTVAAFQNALTGASGAPNLGPLGTYKTFYSTGGGPGALYTGALPGTFVGSLADQVRKVQPGCFTYISWATVMSQAAINSFVSTIPSTDGHGNQMVVGFTYQSEPESASAYGNSGGAQFVSDWTDQARKIRAAASLTGAKLILIPSHYIGAGAPYLTSADHSFIVPRVDTDGHTILVDAYGADFYQHELNTGGLWSSTNFGQQARWSNFVTAVQFKAGSNPQFALTEYGIGYSLTNVGTDANGQAIRLARIKADWAYVQSAFGQGGSVSSQPLFNWLMWETGTTNQYNFTDGATITEWRSIVNSAVRVPGVTV